MEQECTANPFTAPAQNADEDDESDEMKDDCCNVDADDESPTIKTHSLSAGKIRQQMPKATSFSNLNK